MTKHFADLQNHIVDKHLPPVIEYFDFAWESDGEGQDTRKIGKEGIEKQEDTFADAHADSPAARRLLGTSWR